MASADLARGKRRIRQRRQVAPECRRADDGLRQLEGVTEPCRDGAENRGRAGDDLRADTVAWKKKDDCVHKGEIVAIEAQGSRLGLEKIRIASAT